MPVLDARALKKDPKGLAFLRDVLRRGRPALPAVKTDARRLWIRIPRRSAERRPEQASST
jgi:hypothetical protein